MEKVVDRSARGYDSLAPVYQTLESCLFGRTLQHSRVSLLPRLPPAGTALILGDGDGRLLEQFCMAQPHCMVTSLDQSEVMLQRQKQRIERTSAVGSVEFICQDARTFRPKAESFDLVVTAFFLDCFSEQELKVCLPTWLAGVRPGGHHYFVDFVQPRRGWRRYQAVAYQSLMHWFFRWQTGLPNRQLIDLERVLNEQKLSMVEASVDVHPMIACRIFRKT